MEEFNMYKLIVWGAIGLTLLGFLVKSFDRPTEKTACLILAPI